MQGASTMLSLTDCTTQLLKDAQSTIPKFAFHPDPLINIQLRDILVSKIPRSMRFADRNSMAYSVELREPFLDHRIVELGLNQPIAHKINGDTGKYLVRQLANKIIPNKISEAPKRAVQTPQREWLADDLSKWVNQLIAENKSNQFFNSQEMLNTYKLYQKNKPDNSFYIWQLINTLLCTYK